MPGHLRMKLTEYTRPGAFLGTKSVLRLVSSSQMFPSHVRGNSPGMLIGGVDGVLPVRQDSSAEQAGMKHPRMM